MYKQPLLQLTDSELIDLCNEDIEIGLTILLIERGAVIIGGVRLRGILLDPESSESLLADVLVFVWLNIHKFDPSKGSLNGWIIGVAYRILLSQYREKPKHIFTTDRMAEIEYKPQSRPSVFSRIQSQEVRRVIHDLSPRQQTVIRADMASPNGRGDTKELSVKLGCSRNALYDIRHRAHKKIKSQHKRFGL